MEDIKPEILGKHFDLNGIGGFIDGNSLYTAIYGAMEEYHQEQLKNHGDIGDVSTMLDTNINRLKLIKDSQSIYFNDNDIHTSEEWARENEVSIIETVKHSDGGYTVYWC